MTHVVIMAGGIGSRFWPLSVPEYPKQFIDILGCGRTLIQLTVDRFQGICPPENFWVVTNEKYVDIVKEQIPSIPVSHILAEPAARNTAPCIAWASWCIHNEDKDANVVVTPSDAVVMNPVEFQRVIKNALNYTAKHDCIVTIGIKPNRPETGYGSVQANVAVEGEIHGVGAFKEKPNLEIAMQYLEAGNYLWNAGIFVFKIDTMIDAIKAEKPQIAETIESMTGEYPVADSATAFPTCEKVSIDYAVMEPLSAQGKIFTHPADFGWSDLGNWQSLHEKLKKDDDNNASVGNVLFFESSDNVVHVENARRVVLQGLNGYIVSEKNGQILICKRSEEQRIKEFAAEIEEQVPVSDKMEYVISS